MLKEFNKFIMKGNVVDLAVAVIIGGAFGRIVSSFVADVIMPVLSLVIGRIDIVSLSYVIKPAQGETPELAIYYGQFLQNIIDFLIIAFAIFGMVMLIQKAKKKPKPAVVVPAEPSADVKLLTEIRDLLKK